MTFMTLICVLFFIFLNTKWVICLKNRVECGYKQCPPTRDGALNVHLIPHSHMDAGWVKTFDEYYYGTKASVSSANVHLIYHSVLSELLHDRRRRFTLSEAGYFWRWWKEQRPATRSTFRTLVQEGRIEFAGGGWVQNDEATLDYLQIVDQFTWGLRKLNDTLGPCGKPKAAWQIDAYGHTKEQASLLAQMGFDGLFIGRVDYKEREAMIEEDRMEFMWRGSDELGKMSDIMTHNLFNLYNAPDGFCFDFLCTDEPIVDDPDNKVYNADKRVNDFVTQIERQAKYYEHDNILVTMGGDFTYQSAANWFMNMDKLINHVNTHPANLSDINIFYSSPSCYLKAIYLYGRRDKAIYTEKGDYLPYGSDASTYWTGFYTSRPAMKYLARRAHMFLQVVKQLTVISRMGDSYELHLLRHAVSLVLHHDAVTGTSQQHVINDFIRTLTEAIEACSKKVSNILSYLTPTWGNNRRKNNQQFIVCHQLNISQCRFTETQDTMLLIVYNPSTVKTYHYVRLPAIAMRYSIRDANDDEVEYQLVPLPASVINLPGRASLTVQELFFEAEGVPPLGYTSYYITSVRDQLVENEYTVKTKANPEVEHEMTPQISNEYLKVSVNKDTGLLESIQHVDGIKLQMSQNFYYYSQLQQPLQSGAYSFRPSQERPTPVSERITYHAVRGNLVKEIRQKFNDWISQTVRLYRGEEFVELEWVVGPIPLGTDLGKEVVTIFSTNISNNGEFFTDSNGRQMMRRSCWNESAGELRKKHVAACFYPVTTRMCIQSQNSSISMCILPDRTQGGTSYSDGQIELMIHRRLLTDDGFGLEEPLNEEAHGAGLVVKGRHRIIFGNFRQEVEEMSFSERTSHAARRMMFEPWLFLTSGEKINRRKWQSVRNKKYSALRTHAVPRFVHILSLEPWKAGSALLRLENTRQGKYKMSNKEYLAPSLYATVELRRLFASPRLIAARETTLGANQWLEQARQMDWSTRYVYNGGDDGIFPEDNIEDISKESSTLSSYEEPEYATTKSPQRLKSRLKPPYRSNSRTKPRTYDYKRKKRSAYTTDDVRDNIINNTDDINSFLKENMNTTQNKELVKKNAISKNILNNVTGISRDNISYFLQEVTRRPIFRTKAKFTRGLTSSDRYKVIEFNKKNIEEIRSSEEDFSINLKKKSERGRRNWKKFKITDPIKDDIDDGVTKSIYEMYYKSEPRRSSFKPFIRDSEETTKQEPRRKITGNKNRKSKVEENTEEYKQLKQFKQYRHEVKNKKKSKTRKDRIKSVDIPFFVSDDTRKLRGEGREDSLENQKRRKELDEDLDDGIEIDTTPNPECLRSKRRLDLSEEDYEGYETEREDEQSKRRRRKRTADQDDQAEVNASPAETPEDTEHVVTLRPGQIRTFVVWFEKS